MLCKKIILNGFKNNGNTLKLCRHRGVIATVLEKANLGEVTEVKVTL